MRAVPRLLIVLLAIGLLAGGYLYYRWRRPLTIQEIQRIFGEFQYRESPTQPGAIVPDPAWVRENIVTRTMPVVGRVRCHRLIADQLGDAFAEIEAQGLGPEITHYAGCWVPRHQLWNAKHKLSAHSWGIAVDLNPETNRYGTRGDMDRRIVAIFERHGFRWGGRWRPPDPMHFEAKKVASQ
jgi:hypothetical protein